MGVLSSRPTGSPGSCASPGPSKGSALQESTQLAEDSCVCGDESEVPHLNDKHPASPGGVGRPGIRPDPSALLPRSQANREPRVQLIPYTGVCACACVCVCAPV